jgi:hypothetical protein
VLVETSVLKAPFCHRKILPNELIGQAWSRKDKLVKAPHVLAFTEHYNQVSKWVQTAVLAADIKERHEAIRLFVRTADACADMRNFNATFELVAGLESASVYRLKQTWPGLGYADKAKWERVKALSSGSRNRLAYREAAQVLLID